MKIYVGNLSDEIGKRDLQSAFKKYGKVTSVKIKKDAFTGKSKGFGFVEMPKAGEAKAAIKNLNGYKLAGNIIRVKKAEVKKENAEAVAQTSKPAKANAAKKEVKVPVELKNNKDNTLKIYGAIKKSDGEF